jgi:hypothetical protein
LSHRLHHRPELDLLGHEVWGQLSDLNDELAHVGRRDALVNHGGIARWQMRGIRKLGLAPGRQNGGHAHAVWPQFREQAAREHEQTRLRGGIHAPARPGVRGAGAADVHDEAAALPLHNRGGTTATKHRSGEIAGEALRDGSVCLLARGADLDAFARVVDQDIETARMLEHLGHQPVPGLAVRHIGDERLGTDLVCCGLEPQLMASSDPHLRPSLFEGSGDALAEAAGASGNDDGLIFEGMHDGQSI